MVCVLQDDRERYKSRVSFPCDRSLSYEGRFDDLDKGDAWVMHHSGLGA